MKIVITEAFGIHSREHFPKGTVIEGASLQSVVDLLVAAHSCSMGWGCNGFCDVDFVVLNEDGTVVASKVSG